MSEVTHLVRMNDIWKNNDRKDVILERMASYLQTIGRSPMLRFKEFKELLGKEGLSIE